MPLVLLGAGCFGHHGRKNEQGQAPFVNVPGSKPGMVVTAEQGLSGKVARVNPGGRFAVLNFPVGHLPALDQRMNVYRLGLKTGEVKVTGPQYDDNIVADVVAGEVQPGDEVRDR